MATLGDFVETFDLRFQLLLITTFLVVYWIFEQRQTNIPGPISLPLIGNLLSLIRIPNESITGYLEYLGTKYGEICRLYYGRRLIIFLNSYESLYEAYVKHADVFTNRPRNLPGVRDSNRKGVIWNNGRSWKLLRKLALQSLRQFGLGKKSLEERILNEAHLIFDEIVKAGANETPINTKEFMKRAITNIVHSIIFGIRKDYDDKILYNLMGDLDSILTSPGPLALEGYYPWLKLFRGDTEKPRIDAYARIVKYIIKLADEHKLTFDRKNTRDFVDIYLQAEEDDTCANELGTSNLIQMTVDMFAGGTDTTSSSLQWIIMTMVQYPEVQKCCYREIMKMVGNGRSIRLSDRSNLKYVDATLMEIQRLSSVGYIVLPHTATVDVCIRGYVIPKDSIVIGSIVAFHNSPSYWKNAQEFNPTRFLDSNNKIKKCPGFSPFSVGIRSCPGESLARTVLFIFLTNMLQRFRLEKANVDEDLTFRGVSGIINFPQPFQVKVVPR